MKRNNSLSSKTINGVLWNFIEKFFTRGFSIIFTLLLAWFLTPEAYGLIATLTVFILLSKVLVDGGLSKALIRKLDVKDIDLNTVFYTNIFFSFIIYLILYFSAQKIAYFYEEESLTSLIRVAGISVFFNALFIVQQSILQRKLKFKLQLKVQLPATVLSSITAVLLASLGFGVWALIIQMVLNSALTSLFFWRLQLWRPKLVFSFNSLKSLFSFGGYLTLDSLLAVPFKNMYLIVLPKFFDISLVGLYFFSTKIKELILNQFVSSIQTVTYPVLASIQNDNKKLKAGYRRIILIMAYLVSPLLLFLAALSYQIFDLFLPEKWVGAVVYLQLMCIGSLLYPLHSVNLNILKVKGRADLFLYVGIYKKIIGVGILTYTIQFGILEILLGQIVVSLLAYIPNSYYSSKLINYSTKEQITDFTPALILSSAIALVIYNLQNYTKWSSFLEIVIYGGFGICAYVILSYLLKLNGFEQLKGLIIQKLKENKI